jgi:hypothetical protein
MWRLATSTFIALTFFSTVAAAQQPCTTDAGRVVSELYRHILERAPDPGARHWEQQLANGNMTVRELVRNLVTSQEYTQRFGQREAGEAVTYERAVARLYRHVLSRQPDAEGQRNNAISAQQNGLDSVVDAMLNSQEYRNNFGDWGVPGSGGMTFCRTNNNSSANTPVPAPAPTGEARFRGMDINRDGVITQTEWRGNLQAFRNQDWNGDGVLSGDEVRAAGGRAARGRAADFDFDALDVNGNNRIERREWQARLDQFNRLDANGDNFLTRSELGGGGGTVGTAGDVVVVNSSTRWTDTGIDVRVGDMLTFDADGTVTLSDNAGDIADPSGASSGRRAANAPVGNAPAGGLIARIGPGAPVYVGDRRAVRVPRAGRLYLGVNDDHLADNEGTYRVTVNVR